MYKELETENLEQPSQGVDYQRVVSSRDFRVGELQMPHLGLVICF